MLILFAVISTGSCSEPDKNRKTHTINGTTLTLNEPVFYKSGAIAGGILARNCTVRVGENSIPLRKADNSGETTYFHENGMLLKGWLLKNANIRAGRRTFLLGKSVSEIERIELYSSGRLKYGYLAAPMDIRVGGFSLNIHKRFGLFESGSPSWVTLVKESFVRVGRDRIKVMGSWFSSDYTLEFHKNAVFRQVYLFEVQTLHIGKNPVQFQYGAYFNKRGKVLRGTLNRDLVLFNKKFSSGTTVVFSYSSKGTLVDAHRWVPPER
ncbi:MAG: hypothetical protein GY754_11665 [bacterium]|nr:hypothetical protein [bacterium]